MNRFIRRSLRAGLAAMMLAVLAVPVAIADTVNENTVAVTPVVVGDTVVANYWLGENGKIDGDPLNGCNGPASTPVRITVTVNPSAGLTVADPGYVDTAGCGATSARPINLTPTVRGTYTVSGFASGGRTGGTFQNNPVTFTLTVNAAVPTCSDGFHLDTSNNCVPNAPILTADITAPTVACVPAAADINWHDANVSFACTALDPGVTGAITSGLANDGDASFSLSTTVTAGSETADASTGSRDVLDKANNKTTAGPIAGNKIDMANPTFSCGSADGIWHDNDVTIACTAADGGSGLATADAFSLSTSTAVGTESDNVSTGSGDVKDKVGHSVTAGPIAGNKIDKANPTYKCDSADGAWHKEDVTIACTAADGGSGLATAAAFSLSTSTAAGTESDNVSTGSGDVKDKVGHSVTAGPIAGNKIDKKAPSVTIAAPTGTYIVGQSVSSSVSCLDAGSGMVGGSASCPTGAAVDTSVGSKQFSVTASDNVGNVSPASSNYSNYLVTYAIGNLTATGAKKTGSTLPVKIQIRDASGKNLGNVGTVNAAQVTIMTSGNDVTAPEDAGQANSPDSNFRWDATSNQYIYNLQLKDKTTGANLANGNYQLKFTVAGDPLSHSVPFTVGK